MTDAISFASVLADTQNARRKSDLQNLAHAHVELTETLAQGQKLLKQIEALAAEANPSLDDIKKLYDRARRFGHAH